VILPCYNENHKNIAHLEKSLSTLGAEVIIVDDGSKDPYPTAIKHEKNMGYGQSLMTGISKASRSIIVTCDSDGQHRVQDVKNLVDVWHMLDVDMVVGARRLTYEEPLRMFGRKTLNLIASFFTGIYMSDLNSGLRVFKKDIAVGYFPILCKTFSFTTSITMSYMTDNYRVEWFPIKVKEREHGKSHVNVIKDGWVTLKYIIWIGCALRTRRIRRWLRSLR
jgi:glycosyltransferase involved in cell wall biosynthesis